MTNRNEVIKTIEYLEGKTIFISGRTFSRDLEDNVKLLKNIRGCEDYFGEKKFYNSRPFEFWENDCHKRVFFTYNKSTCKTPFQFEISSYSSIGFNDLPNLKFKGVFELSYSFVKENMYPTFSSAMRRLIRKEYEILLKKEDDARFMKFLDKRKSELFG